MTDYELFSKVESSVEPRTLVNMNTSLREFVKNGLDENLNENELRMYVARIVNGIIAYTI